MFKKGDLNTLIATSVAEEGLDIGDFNLIISYDCLASPVRMVQRLGRTGRAGEGKVIILIAKGDEENKIIQSKKNTQKIMKVLKAQSKRRAEQHEREHQREQQSRTGQQKLNFGQTALQEIEEQKHEDNGLVFYSFNPRMIPDDVFSKPIFRKLLPRLQSEKDEHANKNKKPMKPAKEKVDKIKKADKLEFKPKRKSLSQQPSKNKKKQVKIQDPQFEDDISSVGSVGDIGMLEDNDSFKTSEDEPNDLEIEDINEILNATDDLIKQQESQSFSKNLKDI